MWHQQRRLANKVLWGIVKNSNPNQNAQWYKQSSRKWKKRSLCHQISSTLLVVRGFCEDCSSKTWLPRPEASDMTIVKTFNKMISLVNITSISTQTWLKKHIFQWPSLSMKPDLKWKSKPKYTKVKRWEWVLLWFKLFAMSYIAVIFLNGKKLTFYNVRGDHEEITAHYI